MNWFYLMIGLIINPEIWIGMYSNLLGMIGEDRLINNGPHYERPLRQISKNEGEAKISLERGRLP